MNRVSIREATQTVLLLITLMLAPAAAIATDDNNAKGTLICEGKAPAIEGGEFKAMICPEYNDTIELSFEGKRVVFISLG